MERFQPSTPRRLSKIWRKLHKNVKNRGSLYFLRHFGSLWGHLSQSQILRLQGKLTEILTKLYDGLVDNLRTISISDLSRKGTCKND